MSYTIKFNNIEVQDNLVQFIQNPKSAGVLHRSINSNAIIVRPYGTIDKKIYQFNLIYIDTATKDSIITLLNSGEPFDFTPPGVLTPVVVISQTIVSEQLLPYNENSFNILDISLEVI